MAAKTGLLILTNPSHISKILPVINSKVKNILYIHLSNGLHEPFLKYKTNIYTTAPKYSKLVRGIYSQTALLCHNLDVRVLLSGMKYSSVKCLKTAQPIDLVIFDKAHEKSHVDQFLNHSIVNKNPQCLSLTLNNTENSEDETLLAPNVEEPCRHVVLGGTFDRLHIGHKLLLMEAVLNSTEKVTVGVTDTNMLKDKILWELIEPCEKRIELVKNFLYDVCSELSYNVVPIQDPFGPTQSDPTMETIVVSEETLRGGQKVNEIRAKNRLNPLKIISVEMIDCPDKQQEEESKISSSTARMRQLGTLLKEPNRTPTADEPYVIGLTGGIASGKSAVSERLRKMGAAVIDCDKVAHDLYRPGQPCHKMIREAFGTGVISENGEVDRKALGTIVFNNKSEMQRLNSLLWPIMAEETQNRITALYKAGNRVVVVEAAVLIAAGWQNMCQEVWLCIIPPEEAVTRLKNRNKMDENAARARLTSQPSNAELIAHAHVVLCTFWSYDYTQRTVERAWQLLMQRVQGNLQNSKIQ